MGIIMFPQGALVAAAFYPYPDSVGGWRLKDFACVRQAYHCSSSGLSSSLDAIGSSCTQGNGSSLIAATLGLCRQVASRFRSKDDMEVGLL